MPNVMFSKTKLAPVMSLSFKSGLSSASLTAFCARPCPEALPDPMIARPLSRMTVLTSFMSTLISPVNVMTSAMPLAAVQRIWSAFREGAADGLVAKQLAQFVVANDEQCVHGLPHGFEAV